MNAPADSAPGPEPAADGLAASRLALRFGLSEAAAKRLSEAGFSSIERVRAMSPEELREAGLNEEEAERVRSSGPEPAAARPSAAAAGADDDRMTERLLSSLKPRERGRVRRSRVSAKASAEILRKWVDGDDQAMEAWIRSPASLPPPAGPAPPEGSEPGRPDAALEGSAILGIEPTLPGPSAGPASPAAPAAPRPVSAERPTGPLSGGAAPAPEVRHLAEREATLVHWLSELLERVKSEQFDPGALLTELQDLHRDLFDERTRRAELEEEIEQVKRGSIAVIKYVRSREARAREQTIHDKDAEIADLKLKLLSTTDRSEGPRAASPTEAAEIEARLRAEFDGRQAVVAARESELHDRIGELEGEVRDLRAEAATIRDREALIADKTKAIPEAVMEQLKEVEARERELSVREDGLRAKFDEIRAAADELERQREPMRFKEQQLGQWELQLRTLKQALELEARTVEKARAETEHASGLPPSELRKLEELKSELARREDALRNRETLLHQQTEELQGKLAQSEADQIHREATEDAREVKAPTGIRRLDDLLFGGLPAGTQVLLNGPAHTGKEILARMFVAEGLKKGIPAIWVVTDKTYTQIREEMTSLFPTYPKVEREMVRYVDLYSRSLGVSQSEPGVRLFQSSDKGVLEQLTAAVNAYSLELKERAPTYRLVFESVSTVTAYLDTTATFRFLQPFTGRRKLDGAVSYYTLETGMHSESDVETLEHMVDGSINLKVEQLKTFLSVRGITDVQSRAWVGYTFTKRSFSLGSFSLDHIR